MHTDIILTPCLTASGLWYNIIINNNNNNNAFQLMMSQVRAGQVLSSKAVCLAHVYTVYYGITCYLCSAKLKKCKVGQRASERCLLILPQPIWARAILSLWVAAALPYVSQHEAMAQETIWQVQSKYVQNMRDQICSTGKLELHCKDHICRRQQLHVADWLTMHCAAAYVQFASHQLQCLSAQAAMSNKRK